MGAKLKCLNCGDVIQSKSVHDFKWCSCRSVFIDGGNDYTRYGGKGTVHGKFEFIEEGEVENDT